MLKYTFLMTISIADARKIFIVKKTERNAI